MSLDPIRTRHLNKVYPIYKGGLAVNMSREMRRLTSETRNFIGRSNGGCRDLMPLPRIVSTYVNCSATDGGIRKYFRRVVRALKARFSVLQGMPSRSVGSYTKRQVTRKVRGMEGKGIGEVPNCSNRCKGVRLFTRGSKWCV